MGATDDGDDWDFYPCRVDDGAASIFLNLRYEREAPPASADTLFWVRVLMRDSTAHGMGSAEEAEALFRVEDVLTERASALGLVYVGRLRNLGVWQLTFYGPAQAEAALSAVAQEVTAAANRRVEVGGKRDASWGYYRDFLCPNEERRQWMKDRQVVEVLEEKGDGLATPRRVDHWVYIPSDDARAAFIRAAAQEGFSVESTSEAPHADRRFGVALYRADSVDLEHIHGVVMTLRDLATPHGGDYDGWETFVDAPN